MLGYSGSIVTGARAVQHLAHIAIEAELAPLRNTVLVAQGGSAFNESGTPNNPMTGTAIRILLGDLAWWGGALQRARAEANSPRSHAGQRRRTRKQQGAQSRLRQGPMPNW